MKPSKTPPPVTQPAAKPSAVPPVIAVPTATPGGEGGRAGLGAGVGAVEGSGPERIVVPMAPPPFRHGEAELAALTGLHPTALAEARKKCAGGFEQHWALVKNRVAYSEAGLRAVVTFLTGPIEDDLIAGKPLADVLQQTLLKELAPATEPEITGVVCAFYVNTQLIGVRMPDQSIENVRVASRVNFLRGMEVPLRKNAAGRYELARKAPRTPGKW